MPQVAASLRTSVTVIGILPSAGVNAAAGRPRPVRANEATMSAQGKEGEMRSGARLAKTVKRKV